MDQFIHNNIKYTYSILNPCLLLKWAVDFPCLTKQLETMVKVHRQKNFRITNFLYEALLKNNLMYFMIVTNKENTEIVSICRCNYYNEFEENENDDTMFISQFILHQKYRGLKLSNPIMKYFIDYIKNNFEVNCLKLYVPPDHEAAVKCYEQNGFKFNSNIKYDGSLKLVEMEFFIK